MAKSSAVMNRLSPRAPAKPRGVVRRELVLALQVLHDQEVHQQRLRRLWVTGGGAPGAPLSLWERVGVRAAWDRPTHVVERANVRVVQAGDRLRLALEPLLEVGVRGDMLGQHLDGDGAVQAGVPGIVDLTL